MSFSSNNGNGTITLKSFSELASVLDLESLPPGPPDPHDEAASIVDNTAADSHSDSVDEPAPAATQLDLASVIAQLAHVSSDLESMARSDARAREQATVELAQYETLAAERQEAERALAEARHAAVARAAEVMCTQLLAERIRAADELASRPHLTRVLAERRQRVFHPRRHLTEPLAGQHAVGHHAVQARPQLLGGDAREHALELHEPPGTG